MRKSGRIIAALLSLVVGAGGMISMDADRTYAAEVNVSGGASVEAEASVTAVGEEQDSGSDPVKMFGVTKSSAKNISASDAALVFSDEYKGTEFYDNLVGAQLATEGMPIMERVLEVSLSQDGYKNYAILGEDPATLSAQGLLWTGSTLRNAGNKTGNTEYTRWFRQYVQNLSGSYLYGNEHWCAFFTSWCLFQAGYYTGSDLKYVYYSSCADPRWESKNALTTAFNFDQNRVFYTPLANKKLAAYSSWNTFINTNIDPYDLPFKPGGLVFFSWDGSGDFFDHVGIVKSYDADRHILYYMNGNSGGQAKISCIYLDQFCDYRESDGAAYNYSGTLMAYAEYTEQDSVITGKWKKNGKGWWWQDSTGWYPTDQWMSIDGELYHFNKAGYLDVNGYYGGYQVDKNGARVNDVTYSWKNTSDGWKFVGSNGTVLTSTWTKINGSWYYFKSNGIMAEGEWINRYWIGGNGKWTYPHRCKWHQDAIGWWLGDGTGWYAQSVTMYLDEVGYDFNDEGYLIEEYTGGNAREGNPDY